MIIAIFDNVCMQIMNKQIYTIIKYNFSQKFTRDS